MTYPVSTYGLLLVLPLPLLMIWGHFSESVSLPWFPTPKWERQDGTFQFGRPLPRSEEIPAQNDRVATNPTRNPSTVFLVSFQLTSNAIRALQPTPSGSLVSIIPDLIIVKTLVHIQRPLKFATDNGLLSIRNRQWPLVNFEPRAPGVQIYNCAFNGRVSWWMCTNVFDWFNNRTHSKIDVRLPNPIERSEDRKIPLQTLTLWNLPRYNLFKVTIPRQNNAFLKKTRLYHCSRDVYCSTQSLFDYFYRTKRKPPSFLWHKN